MTLPVRKRIRLENYDYSSEGYYFVTICAKNMRKVFGKINSPQTNTVQLSRIGKITEKQIQSIGAHYSDIRIEKYVIMPNHIHMIIVLGCQNTSRHQERPSLSSVVGLFKSGVSREIGMSIWQARFHDHVIRNEEAFLKIWNYIDTNPLLWEKDKFFVL